MRYRNGNADITIHDSGTRVITFDDTLELEYPLNIDIRVSNRCSFGMNPKTGKAFCTFCHESATTDGSECDYDKLKETLSELPQGIEFAIGSNNITDGLIDFIEWVSKRGNIANITINQGHVKRDLDKLKYLIENDFIKGLGVSYRSGLKFDVPQYILDYEHTVFHVICGIDRFSDVESLVDVGVRKVLLLGYKTFGFGVGYMDEHEPKITRSLKEWCWWVHKLFSKFDAVSFDNLALEQLRMNRFFTENNWAVFNQMENSLYVEAVKQEFSPSSRSDVRVSFDEVGIKEYFNNL